MNLAVSTAVVASAVFHVLPPALNCCLPPTVELGDRCAQFAGKFRNSPPASGTADSAKHSPKPSGTTDSATPAGETTGDQTSTAAVPQAGAPAAEEPRPVGVNGAEAAAPQADGGAGAEQQPQGTVQGVADGGRRMK